MTQTDPHLHPDFQSGRVLATQKPRGFIRSYTYYFLTYLFFMITPAIGYDAGIFADPNWLGLLEVTCITIMGLLAYPEAVAFMRIAASCASEKQMFSGIVGGKDGLRITEWVFDRPHALYKRRFHPRKPLETAVDYPPMLLRWPVEVLGNLHIMLDEKLLIANAYDIQLIGFERYQVSHYPEMQNESPHILARLTGGQRVIVIGKFSLKDHGISQAPGSKLLLIDPESLNAFMWMNMWRLIFLAAAVALLAIRLLA